MNLEKSNLIKRLITIKSVNDFQAHTRTNIPEEPTLKESMEVSSNIIERLKKSLLTSNIDNVKVYYSPDSITDKTPGKSIRISNEILNIE